MKWYKVADSIHDILWQSNTMAVVAAGSRNVTLVKHKGQVFACSTMCPHAGGHLADGFADGKGNIVCPLHFYKFSLLNGYNVSGEGYRLTMFKVKESEAGVFVGFPEPESPLPGDTVK